LGQNEFAPLREPEMSPDKQPDETVDQQDKTVLSRKTTGLAAGIRVSDDVLAAGTIINDRYQVISLLGVGGMGAVYLVENILLKQKLALKTLSNQSYTDVAIRRFQKEAQAAAKLAHPNLVKAHEFGVLESGEPYFTMDFVEGPSLSEYVKEIGTISIDEALSIFIPICFGLGYAHQQNVIHRDIKPSNIMLARTSEPNIKYVPKVVEFGIAKLTDNEEGKSVMLTKTGEVFGTPLYMSPEQCLGTAVDSRSDIYSLGCVLYEVLTGAPPFTGESALNLMMKHQSEIPPSLKEASMGREFPELLERIVSTAIAKGPNERYQNCYDFAQDLAILKKAAETPELSRTLTDRVSQLASKDPERTTFSIKTFSLMALAAILFFVAGGLIALHFIPKNEVEEKASVLTDVTLSSLTEAGSDHYFRRFITGAKPMRVFEFPKFPIGKFGYLTAGAKKFVDCPAKGVVQIPLAAMTKLEIDDDLLFNKPQSLYLFQDTDINMLHIHAKQNVKDLMVNKHIAYDSAMSIAAHWKYLGNIKLDHAYITDIGLNSLASLEYLRAVNINNAAVSVEAIGRLKNFDTLHELGVGGIAGANRLVDRISRNQDLRGLNLNGTKLNDSDIEKLSNLKKLRILEIRRNPAISDASASFLANMQSLVVLDIVNTAIKPASGQQLARIKTLQVLNVSNELWTERDCSRIRNLLPKQCLLNLWHRRGDKYDVLKHWQ